MAITTTKYQNPTEADKALTDVFKPTNQTQIDAINAASNLVPTIISKPTTDPTITSNNTRTDVNSLGTSLTELKKASATEKATLEAERLARETRRVQEIKSIETNFKIAQAQQDKRQAQQYAGRATSLVTSGGGFLGATQSQEGVLQNLSNTFEAEKTALIAKKNSAIDAANNAFENKDFALAREMAKNAKDTQQEIYNREQDFNNQKLALAKENRAKIEFNYGIADKKAATFADLNSKDYKTVTDAQKKSIDINYFPGYMDNLQKITNDTKKVKTEKDAVVMESNILSMRLKMPIGKKFTLNGVTYTGMKQDSLVSGTQADRNMANKQKVQSWFTSATVIPGTNGIPFLDSSGKATPEGWQTAYEYSGMNRRKFIQEFSYLLRQSGKDSNGNPLYDNYGLTPSEIKIVNTLVPINF